MLEKIGPYRVEGEIGRGGMGVVYRATDPRLDRAVALKALPDDLAGDADRLARFETEARTLAALNHPNVAGIHGLEEAEGRRYLVLELVEGRTLAEILAQGPLPVDQALDYATQIASGLAAAHEAGIVHRDLKPGNVKVTPEDKVKVLDFGLAKSAAGAWSSSGDAESPTMSAATPHSPTLPGMIMGTAGYMSPEQARGKAVDRRSDLFAFGCVLYEMLTGSGPFAGETVTDSIGAVLHREPDWSKLPAGVPSRLRLLLERCLAKDRERRLHDVADARIEIEDLRAGGAVAETGTTARKPPWAALAVAFSIGALVAAGALWLAARPDTAPRPVRRFALSGMGMPVDAFQGLALSPDGSKLIVRARDEEGNELLQMRSFDSFELWSLPGSQFGWLPFFAPGGTRVGFYTSGLLKSVDLHGGLARTIATLSESFSGGVWLADDTIVFAGLESGRVFRVSADGGEVETIELDGVAADSVVTSPSPLPGGKALLCSVRSGSRFDVAVFDLDERKLHVVIEDGFTPQWAHGHVLYQQGQSGPLAALPFDPERLVALGSPFPVLDDLGARVSFQVRMFTVADDGTLAFIPRVQRPDRASLIWLDADGHETPIAEIDRVADSPRISGDGKRIAFRAPAPNCDIWVHDLQRGTTTRVTHEKDNHGVAWWPGDRRLVFARQGEGTTWGVFSAPADGAGHVEKHMDPSIQRGYVLSVAPDGNHALVAGRAQETNANIGVVSLEDGTYRDLLDSRFDEQGAVFSPNGRFIAYSSNESGRSEVYVQPFPALDARTQVSNEGGSQPVWSRDGTKLYFLRGRALFAADVQTSSVFSAMRPVELLEADFATSAAGTASYDVAPDGKRFAVFRSSVGQGQVEVKVILNWFDELEKLAAAGG